MRVGDPDGRAELDVLFERFLNTFNRASAKYGNLFPFNRLRNGWLARLGRQPFVVAVIDDDVSTEYTVAASRDRIERCGSCADLGPSPTVWTVARSVVEDVALRPWIYLTDPRRLGVGWFDVAAAPLGHARFERGCSIRR